MRVSSETLPSFTGTFRSARMSTRLPARSRSVMLMTAMNATSNLNAKNVWQAGGRLANDSPDGMQ